MGYYENPPIINLNSGAEKIAAGAASAANSIAEALIRRGDRKRAEEKEQKLTIQKLQDQKNKTDLYYNEKLSDWATKNTSSGNEVDKKIRGLLQDKIQRAADAQIALSMETDPSTRTNYLKVIRDADTFMTTAANFGKNVAMDTATWRENAPGIAVGVSGGYVVNGKDDNEIYQRTGAVEILGGMTNAYDNSSVDIIDEGGTFSLKISGKRKGATQGFNDLIINADSYLSSDKEGGGGFLQKVENIDDFHKVAKKGLLDEKGDIIPSYLSGTTETVYVPGKGDKYKLEFAQKFNTENAKAEIKKQSDVKASGYLRVDKESSLRALVDYTLKQQPGFYDKNFKGKDPGVQKELLSGLLTNEVFNTMTSKMEKTFDKDGNTIYWGGKKLEKTKEAKPSKGSGSGSGAGDGLTANKRLELSELEANATKQRKKLTNTKDTKPVYSADNRTRIIWDGNAWVRQVKMSSGGYEEDLDSPPIRSKNKAAAEFLGYGLP
jgi:hypothetical protein